MSTPKRANPLDRYARDLPYGQVRWIGIRPKRRDSLIEVTKAVAVAHHGLEGDHRMTKTPGSGRQITLISTEFIGQIEHFIKKSSLDPGLFRRNLVVSGINLNALRRQRFWVGEALLEATQLCHPCARMEQALGQGGVAAMIGHGGLCARILRGGVIALGDDVRVDGHIEPQDLALPLH